MRGQTMIGVIGGSGLYEIEGLEGAEWVDVDSPWGAPSDQILTGSLGGVAMAIGAYTFGSRVTDTVGKSITPLDYGGALAAQLSAAIGVHLFSMAGIPVSTSQAVVGGVIGVGLTKGARAVSFRRISTIFVGWVATPLCAAVFAAVVYRLIA